MWWQDQAVEAGRPVSRREHQMGWGVPWGLTYALPRMFAAAVDPNNRGNLDSLERDALRFQNEAEQPGEYRRRPPVSYRDALPLAIAAGFAKIFGMEDAEIGQGLQGFYGARQDAEERDYQNFMASDARRRAGSAAASRESQLRASQLREAMARRDEAVRRAREEYGKRMAFENLLKLEPELRAPSLYRLLQEGDPQAASFFARKSAAEIAELLGGSTGSDRAPDEAPADRARRPLIENELEALARQRPEAFAELWADQLGLSFMLPAEEMAQVRRGVELFMPGLRRDFMREYAKFLQAKRGGRMPTEGEASGLIRVLSKQMELFDTLAEKDSRALPAREALRSFAQNLFGARGPG